MQVKANRPEVSVIMPTYNREDIIGNSVESVLRQTYGNFELIIIDDGSTDGTDEVIKQLGDNRIRYERSMKNRGACYARNCGLKLASGKYVAFLDSDNIWDENYLQARVDGFELLGDDVGLIWGPIRLNDGGRRCRVFPDKNMRNQLCGMNREQLITELIFDNQIDTNAVMLRKSCANQVEGFAEELRRLQDWEYFFRIAISTKCHFLYDDRVFVTNYIRDDSIGAEKTAKNYWDARIYFINKYRNVINTYTDGATLLKHLLEKEKPKATKGQTAALLNCFDSNEMAEVFWSYLRNIKKGNQYIAYMNALHEKECSIIAFNDRWIRSVECSGTVIVDNLKKEGCQRIAIYGMGWIGKLLYDNLLSHSEIEVKALVDKKIAGSFYNGMPIVSPNELPDDIDVVVITILGEEESIRRKLGNKMQSISVEELI